MAELRPSFGERPGERHGSRLVGYRGEYVIKGATVLDASGRRRADVAVRDGLVAAVEAELAGGVVLDAGGCVLTPGLVELNAGVGEPGREECETIDSAARAAALGGYTTLVARADTDPVVDAAALAQELLARGAGACCRVVPVASVSVGRRGEQLSPMAELAALGVRLFCDDGVGVRDARLLRRALEYAAGLEVTVAQFAEEPALAAGGQLHEGAWSARLGIAGIPSEAEEVVVMRDLALARLTGVPLHFRALSTAASWAMVTSARRGGLAVTAEVALPNLLLSDAACADFDPATKFRPPLRGDDDRAALIARLAAGEVDALVSGHTPHSLQDKEVPFDEALPGASLLQWTVALALTELVGTGTGTGIGTGADTGSSPGTGVGLAELIAALAWRPAAVLAGIGGNGARPTGMSATMDTTVPVGMAGTPTVIVPGVTADLTVIDPAATWTVDPATGASRSRSTPFAGRALRGRVRHTIVGGEPVVIDAEAQR